MRARTLLALSALCALAGVPLSALAALGEPRESIASDRSALGGAPLAAVSGVRYTVESFDLHGTTVREFVRADGTVFAVAWEGLAQPDLSGLLGAHAADWRVARGAPRAHHSRSHRRLVAGAAIVETWGHMRHLAGRAFLPALVPAEVDPDEIH